MINYTEPKLKDFKCFKLPIDELPKYKELLILGNVYNFFGTYKDGDLSDFTQTPWAGEGATSNFMSFGQFVMNGGHATIIASKETCNYYRTLYKEFYKAGFGTTHPKVVLFEIDDTKFLKGNFKIKDGKEEKLVKGEYFWTQGKDGKWEFNYPDFLKSFFENGEKRMFDLIIANPPYHNRLYKSIIEICHKYAKETCVLCPWEFVDHKVEKRFQDFIDQNLNALEKIDNSKREFFDIGKDSLGIVCLGEKRLNLKDFQTDRSYKSKITDLLIQYNENKNNFKVYVQPNRNPDKFKGKLNTANCFAKACRGGFHFGGRNFDYIFNTTKDPKIIFSGEDGLKIGQDIILLDLENPDKKANLVKWIYNSKLALILVEEGLKDSRSTLGSFHTLIPFVDWSRTWTDQEILKELGLPEDFLEEKE